LILVDKSGSPSSTKITSKSFGVSFVTIASCTFPSANFFTYAIASAPNGFPTFGTLRHANLQRFA
jgi:hypothetical protein